jgi:hypothetical protein
MTVQDGPRKVCTRIVAATLWALVAAPPASSQTPGNVEAAADPVMRQLEAFRRGDYELAYSFASSEIRQRFGRPDFEQMVRAGYPEIARSVSAVVFDRQQASNGHVYLRIKIRGANGNAIEALYEMVWERDGWRINGVVTKPDPGVA